MSRASLLERIVPKVTAATIEARLAKARQVVEAAEARYRAAALDTVTAGQDSAANEDGADKALAKARQDVTRLEAALNEAQARESADAHAKRQAVAAAEDAKVAKAFADWADAAKAAGPALEAYAKAYDALVATGRKAHALALTNPRARQDLLSQDVQGLVSLELTRIAKAHLPPGADRWAATSRNPADIPPLADHFAGLAGAVLGQR
jgi:hypothetical protein